MKIIGLSGNRYSGKNRVCKIFEQIGVSVFHADVVLKFILNYNYLLQSEIINEIGRQYHNGESFNIEKIKRDGLFEKVLKLAEPELFKTWNKFNDKHRKSIYTIFHSSILFESGWDKLMDLNISVFSPTGDRVQRCKLETGTSVSSIYSLLNGEMDEFEKNGLSDYVIHNYNDETNFWGDTLTQVNKIDYEIVDAYLKEKISVQTI
jgi:dephospho-CoA kinase